jgi:four helix bundle protein
MARNFKSIKAWQLADDLAVAIYDATKSFPSQERYGLTLQMRRAAVSVPANIAEGATRISPKEYTQFLSIAKGSLAEVEYYIHLGTRLGYLTESQEPHLVQLQSQTARTLHGLFRYLQRE